MSVVTGALGSLGPKLLQLLQDEYKLQKGVKKQVQWLSDELESVSAFLHKVADVPWYQLDEQVKVWARQVREASYDMEDVLDTFLVHVDSGDPADTSRLKHAMKKIGKVFSKAKTRRTIAGAIEDIKKHMDEIARRRQSYKVDENMSKMVATTTESIDPRLTAMYKKVSELIGVDKSRDELISMLMPSEMNDDGLNKNIMQKISIFGVGGLGKTTLAKAVYDKLKSQYDCVAFVSVGREHDLATVLKNIFFELDTKTYENIHNTRKGVDLLIRGLREFLKNKSYFVVVDDVWDVKTWERIKLALVDNNCGSKVITTTRKLDVAKEAGEVYELQPLSHGDSKKLFYTRVFGADRKYHDDQPDDISNKILKKCDGIPLAIITMASLLVGNPKDEWYDVYNSIGFGRNEDNKNVEEDIMVILSFSYYDLPSHLRTCLLYLSTYPEDYFIHKDSLIWKWIAEGFVLRKQGTRLFDIGERYFNDLVNRSMIQVEINWNGEVYGCRVHDMVLRLMRKISSEENFIALLDNNVDRTCSLSNARRVAHQNATPEHIKSKAKVLEMPTVRSYTSFSCINSTVQFSGFKLLRVLDIVDCSFKEGSHLEQLGKLLHLRYLGLKDYDHSVPDLPKQIENLKLLQTLDVRGRINGVLPASIVTLTQLVCLRALKTDAPDGIGKLTSLEELRIRNFKNTAEGFVKELGSLRELRVLEFVTDVMGENMQINFVESLRNLQKIQHIQVTGVDFDVDTTVWEEAGVVLPRTLYDFSVNDIHFSKMPSCINPSRLPNLSNLELSVTTMDEHDLKLLARLPSLCFLYLDIRYTATTCNINAADGFFQKLRNLWTTAMVQFEQPDEEDSSVSFHIWSGDGALPFGSGGRNCSKVVPSVVMPNLEVLVFSVYLRALKDNNRDCRYFGLEHLPSLRHVTGRFINRARVSAVEVDAEVDAACAELRNACEVHPNHPILATREIAD